MNDTLLTQTTSILTIRQRMEKLNERTDRTLDVLIAPGFRLWMLLALVLAILLVMTVVVCCFIKLRIPRTKREIELNAVSRKLHRKSAMESREEQRLTLTDHVRDNGSDRSEENIMSCASTEASCDNA